MTQHEISCNNCDKEFKVKSLEIFEEEIHCIFCGELVELTLYDRVNAMNDILSEEDEEWQD